MLTSITKSSIHQRTITGQGEVNGRWVIETSGDPALYPAGTIVCEPAPTGEDSSLTFTASNGRRYYDTESGSRWRPRFLDDAPPPSPGT